MASAFEPPASVEAEFNESAAGKGFFRSFGRARVEAGAEPAMVGMAESDPFEPKAEALRSAAPTPPRTHSFNRRTGIFAVALLVIFAVMAAVAIKFRDKPEDFVRARPAASTEANEPSAGKIGGRAGEPITNAPAPATPSPTATAAAPAAPSVPVAQRAALLIEAPDEPNKVKTYVGTVVWSLTPGADGLPSLQAQVDIPDAKLSVSVVMTKNTNDALSASNRIAVRFKPSADGPVTGIKQIASPEMRGEDRPQGDALTGLPAQVTPNYFWIALAKDDLIMSRNMTLMRDRGWFDLPLLLDNDKIAKITVEKGAGGDQLLRQALAAWGQ